MAAVSADGAPEFAELIRGAGLQWEQVHPATLAGSILEAAPVEAGSI